MPEDENTATILIKFLQALELLGQVYNSDVEFAKALMPEVTEQFLIQCGQRIEMIEEALKG